MVQTEGYSLDAQQEKLRKYAVYKNFEIAGEYCDAGKSGNTHRPKKESYITLDVEMEDYYRIKNEGKNSNTGK